jgi:hypothetical protein
VNNFEHFITPEQALEKGDTRSLDELKELAKSSGTCCNCDEEIWRYAGVGMCFSCTTGESDASDDFELAKD